MTDSNEHHEDEEAGDEPLPRKRTRRRKAQRSFPASSFEEALQIGDAIQRFGGGHPRIRRLTLFENLGRSPDSGLSRQQISNSTRYGITTGSYGADFLELTPKGATATSSEVSKRERTRARFDLAIRDVEPFNSLYETFHDRKLPAQEVMRDQLVENGMSAEDAQECAELFILNAKFVGVLRPVAGSERILTIEHVLEELPARSEERSRDLAGTEAAMGDVAPVRAAATGESLDDVCFYITPIGDEGSDERKHADVFLSQIVEPAIDKLGLGLRVVRADHIDLPGLITAQVVEHVLRARLVVADLSFHNPNVFYELALRHATGKPTIHLCREADALPFDMKDVRTIRLDTTDIHSFVTQMETWRAELTNMARHALDEPESGRTPLHAFAGSLQVLSA